MLKLSSLVSQALDNRLPCVAFFFNVPSMRLDENNSEVLLDSLYKLNSALIQT